MRFEEKVPFPTVCFTSIQSHALRPYEDRELSVDSGLMVSVPQMFGVRQGGGGQPGGWAGG